MKKVCLVFHIFKYSPDLENLPSVNIELTFSLITYLNYILLLDASIFTTTVISRRKKSILQVFLKDFTTHFFFFSEKFRKQSFFDTVVIFEKIFPGNIELF